MAGITMFMLIATDLTGLGGPMGTETTKTIFREFFTTMPKAKRRAEEHYKKNKGTEVIQWKGNDKAATSGDLRWVMYSVKEVKPQ